MDKLILHPSAMAQWYTLINEAEQASALELGEEVESYLVFLLMRFTTKPEMAASVLAVEFLQSLKLRGELRQLHLRDLGDKCLLFSGLFPERAARRHVNAQYFMQLGQSAYSTLADDFRKQAALFAKLSECFEALTHILLRVRNQHSLQQKLSPATALINDLPRIVH